MSKVIIILEDLDGDEISIKVEFGENGINKDSTAHYLAAEAITHILEQRNGEVTVND